MIIRSIFKDQRRLFWTLQLGGWLTWGVIAKYAFTRAMLEDTAPGYFLYVMVITVIGMVLTLGLRIIYRYLWKRSAWVQTLGFIGGSSAVAYLWLTSRSYIYSNWFESYKDMDAWLEKMGTAAELYQKVSYMDTFLSSCTVMIAWSVFYFAIKYYQIFQEVQKSALKSAAMAHEAQLKMLRYQLNPHFLFNTLNAISTLVLEQQNLDIEKVRFEERLNLELDIADEAFEALIPSLLLQPLVENAIKYGIAQSEEGGHLRIAARVFAGELLLELSDDGPGVELIEGQIPDANGVGLRNTRERLAELYGNEHSFRLAKTEPHGLTINIRIPFESA